MTQPLAEFELSIAGLGIVLFSPGCVASFEEGSDVFENELGGDGVARHASKGSMLAVATGTPGDFLLRVHLRAPSETELRSAELQTRAGLVVKGAEVHFVDLYWLLEWNIETPGDQVLRISDGMYVVVMTTGLPTSGIWGEDQLIDVFFEASDVLPHVETLPMLCPD